MGPILGEAVFALLYLFVWGALPPWLRASLKVLLFLACCTGLLFLHRIGLSSLFGEIFVGMGHSLWSLIKGLATFSSFVWRGMF